MKYILLLFKRNNVKLIHSLLSTDKSLTSINNYFIRLERTKFFGKADFINYCSRI